MDDPSPCAAIFRAANIASQRHYSSRLVKTDRQANSSSEADLQEQRNTFAVGAKPGMS
jgi:hypothetical protein